MLFIFLSLMLSLSLYTILKLSKTTSPQRLFPSDYIPLYTVMQSDRNSSTTDTFHKPITYEPHV